MTQVTINADRSDPYKNYQFRVRINGAYVAGISRCSPLRRTTEVLAYRAGDDPSTSRKSPGRTEYDAIVLERGVTQDLEFEAWANQVSRLDDDFGGAFTQEDFRKEVAIDFFNEGGQLVLSYRVHRCWVSEYVALPHLDANDTTIAIQLIRLENEGWQRDSSVVEPTEPTPTGGGGKGTTNAGPATGTKALG
jgi:phage tail-like protein